MRDLSRRVLWFGLGVLLLAMLGVLTRFSGEDSAHAQSNLNEEVVYLDPDGIVRVLDPPPPGGLPDGYTVTWFSPSADGPWQAIAVGDFNADGDDEIVAIRQSAINGFNLAIYDPVVSPANEVRPENVKAIDGIPWRRLFDTTLSGSPELVAAGDFDLNTAGDEIFLSSRLGGTASEVSPAVSDRRFMILHRAADDVDGANWTGFTQPLDSEIFWQTVAAGNVDLEGPDEIVLTGDDGYLHVYRVEGDQLTLVFSNDSESRPWQDAIIGQFFSGGLGEVAAVRKANADLPRFFVFSYDPTVEGNFRDRYSEYLSPSPKHVFGADINGNGDEELFLLRDPAPSPPTPTPTPLPRVNLIMRNFSGDAIPNFEVVLTPTSDNYAGVGGDLDGDTRDEIVIAAPDRIRIFYQPESTQAGVNTTFTDNILPTDARTVRSGNLDLNGIHLFPNFVATPVALTAQLPSGEQSTQPSTLELAVEHATDTITYSITVSGAPDWLTVTPLSGVMPATLRVSFDAYGLAPLTNESTTLLATALDNAPVLNSPLSIPVTLQVQPGIYPQPSTVTHAGVCNGDSETPFSTKIAVGGLLSVPFSAHIEPASATWVDFTAAGNLLPTNVTLTIDPSLAPPNAALQEAALVIDAQSNQGVDLSISLPIRLICQTTQVWLPVTLLDGKLGSD